jgi:hypothetical protein
VRARGEDRSPSFWSYELLSAAATGEVAGHEVIYAAAADELFGWVPLRGWRDLLDAAVQRGLAAIRRGWVMRRDEGGVRRACPPVKVYVIIRADRGADRR